MSTETKKGLLCAFLEKYFLKNEVFFAKPLAFFQNMCYNISVR